MFQIVLIFSSKQEVLFSYGSSLLSTVINSTRQNVGGEARNGLEERDILMQLFSPLVASHMTMTETLKMPYECIETTNDHCILFKNRSDCVLLTICQRLFRSDECLLEELKRVEWIIDNLVGPCWSKLSPDSLQLRTAYTRLLKILLEELWVMESKEFNLMFSAIERVSLSESIKELGIDCMSQCMNRLKKSGDKRMKHILILVGSKLFCLYSAPTAFRLCSQHILLFVLLCNALHNRHDRDSYITGGEGSDSFLSCVEKSSEEEMYFSQDEDSMIEVPEIVAHVESETVNFTPRNSTPEPSVIGIEKPLSAHRQHSISLLVSGSTHSVHNAPDCANNNCAHAATAANLSENDTSVKGHQATSVPVFVRTDSDDPEYLAPLISTIDSVLSSISYRMTRLILNSRMKESIPCNVHLLKLHSNIILIGVEEFDFSSFAGLMSTNIRKLEDFLHGKVETLYLKDFIKFIDNLKLHVNRVPTLSVVIRFLDSQLVRLNKELSFEIYLSAGDLSMNVRTIMDNIYGGLIRVFSDLFLSILPEVDQRLCKVMIQSAKSTRKRLRDYLPFLSVKAERNLAPTGFYTLFPGLVHFIWINRVTDEMIVPAFDTDFLKVGVRNRLWRTINWCRRQCHEGGFREIYYRDTALQYTLCARISRASQSFADIEFQDGSFELCLVHLACVPRQMVQQHQLTLIRTIVRRVEDTVISLGLLT